MVWSLRPNDIEVELLLNSRKVYESLEQETGINSGWIKNGGLFIAYDKVLFKKCLLSINQQNYRILPNNQKHSNNNNSNKFE